MSIVASSFIHSISSFSPLVDLAPGAEFRDLPLTGPCPRTTHTYELAIYQLQR